MNGKICRIVDNQFSWSLDVDGRCIPFQGRANVEYFQCLYKSLGYKVIVLEAR